MGRWGEEEKKSKGIFGCAIAFFILGLSLYVFYVNYSNLEGRRLLEKAMQDSIRQGANKTEEEMIGEILTAAEDIGIDVPPEQIDLKKSYDDYNNPVVDVFIDFTFTVDILVTDFEVSIPIVEEVTIVTL